MFDILPPLWTRGSIFAMREYLTGSVTSVFFTLPIDGAIRHFHSYCDLSVRSAVEHLRLMQKAGLEADIARLERLRAAHDDDQLPSAVRSSFNCSTLVYSTSLQLAASISSMMASVPIETTDTTILRSFSALAPTTRSIWR